MGSTTPLSPQPIPAFILDGKGGLFFSHLKTHERLFAYDRLKAALETPSLYDETLALLTRRGFDLSNGSMAAWKTIYQNTDHHWDLFALAAAGAISVADTARLLRIRGRAMQAAVPVGQGAMAAVLGLDAAAAEKVAAE